MDATLHYHAQAIKSLFLPLKQATLDLNLDHGVLAIDPVAFDFPQGRFTAQVTLDARGAVPITDTDMRLSNVSLQEFSAHPVRAVSRDRGDHGRPRQAARGRRLRATRPPPPRTAQ